MQVGEGVIKKEAGILYQIYRFRGGVNKGWSKIHESKSWYYLEHFQISMVKLLVKIVFGYKLLTFFVKSSKLDVSPVS